MSCPYATPEPISITSIKPKLRADPKIGTQIRLYDQEFIWTAEHKTPSELNEWRKQGDSIIDRFFQIYGEQLRDGDDTYEKIHQLVDDQQCSIDSLVQFGEKIRERPIWFNRDEIQRGQNFFLRYGPQTLTSIFNYTLILGYGFQQLNDVLLKTEYLSSSDLRSTFRRLVETLQMIATAVCGDVDDFDQTFSDVIRVRLLHGMVRYKIVKHYHQQQFHNNEIPINQEDQLVTLLGFSFSVLHCMEERMNILVTDEDKHAYLHLWRYIGWLIGIDDEHLTYFRSYQSTRIISESIFYHFYSPSSISKHMAHHSLMASYCHGPMPLSLQFHFGLSQILLGKQISHALDIDLPSINQFNTFAVHFFLWTLRFGGWLAGWNSPRLNRWIIKRQRQRLCFLVFTFLNNELCNFSLFKSYRSDSSKSTTKTNENLSKQCSCRYDEKKQNKTIVTKDIGPIRIQNSFSLTFFLQQSVYILIFVLLVRFWTNVNV